MSTGSTRSSGSIGSVQPGTALRRPWHWPSRSTGSTGSTQPGTELRRQSGRLGRHRARGEFWSAAGGGAGDDCADGAGRRADSGACLAAACRLPAVGARLRRDHGDIRRDGARQSPGRSRAREKVKVEGRHRVRHFGAVAGMGDNGDGSRAGVHLGEFGARREEFIALVAAARVPDGGGAWWDAGSGAFGGIDHRFPEGAAREGRAIFSHEIDLGTVDAFRCSGPRHRGRGTKWAGQRPRERDNRSRRWRALAPRGG